MRQVVDVAVFIDEEDCFAVPFDDGDDGLTFIRDQYFADGVAKAIVNRLFLHDLFLHALFLLHSSLVTSPSCQRDSDFLIDNDLPSGVSCLSSCLDALFESARKVGPEGLYRGYSVSLVAPATGPIQFSRNMGCVPSVRGGIIFSDSVTLKTI